MDSTIIDDGKTSCQTHSATSNSVKKTGVHQSRPRASQEVVQESVGISVHFTVDQAEPSALQVLHSRGNHWIVAAGKVNVFDSSVDKGTLKQLFGVHIKVKMESISDCGLFD